MKTYLEILERIKVIQEEVRKGNVSDELNSELDGLIEQKKVFEEKQARMEEKFANANVVKLPEARVEQDLTKMSKRDKLNLIAGKQARNKAFTEAETRALGTALTTTATTFTQATELVEGVNNAGVLISARLIFELLKEEGKLSPILADINFTNIPGYTEFPYRKSRDKARKKVEGAAGLENQMEWAKLQLMKGYLQTIIAVTDEVRSLTDFDFGAYIIDQMLLDLNDDWAEKLIYGTGTDDEVKGITIGALKAVAAGYAAGGEVDAIVAGIKQLKGKYRRGAKIYAAQDVNDAVLFAKDAAGDFIYPIFNNNSGVSSVGTMRMEVDENLAEGDFVIGNINTYFKANILIPIRIETDRQARKGITEYVASCYSASAPVPGSIVHGTKA